MEWLRERLSHIKLPKALDFHPKLPRLDNGKLYKRHLMEEYKGGARAEDKTED
jgi:fatty-acyl-CoA synthase